MLSLAQTARRYSVSLPDKCMHYRYIRYTHRIVLLVPVRPIQFLSLEVFNALLYMTTSFNFYLIPGFTDFWSLIPYYEAFSILCRFYYLVETFSSEIFYVNHSSLRRNMDQCGAAIPFLPSLRVTQTDGRRSSELNKVWLTEERSTAPFICNLQPPYPVVPFHHSQTQGTRNS